MGELVSLDEYREERFGSAWWQHRRFDSMRFDLSHKSEMKIREIARQAAEDPRTYRGGLCFAWSPEPVRIVTAPDTTLFFHTIQVRLNLELEGDRDAATLIAEEIVRHELEKLRA